MPMPDKAPTSESRETEITVLNKKLVENAALLKENDTYRLALEMMREKIDNNTQILKKREAENAALLIENKTHSIAFEMMRGFRESDTQILKKRKEVITQLEEKNDYLEKCLASSGQDIAKIAELTQELDQQEQQFKEVKQLKQQLEKDKSDIKDLTQKLEQHQLQLIDQQKQIEAKEIQITAIQSDIKKLEQVLTEQNQELTQRHNDLDKDKQHIGQLEKELTQLKQETERQLTIHESNIKKLEQQLTEKNQELSQLQNHLDKKYTQQVEQLERELAQLKQEKEHQLTTSQSSIKKLEQELITNNQELTKIQNNLNKEDITAKLRTTINEAQQRIEQLENELKAFKAPEPSPEQPKAAIPAQSKAGINKTLKKLGVLSDIAIQDKDTLLENYIYTLENEINETDDAQLNNIILHIQQQIQLKKLVQSIISTLEQSNRWYTSGALDKAKAIKTAFNSIPVKQRLQLANKNENDTDETMKSFFTALSKQRAWIFKTTKAASFTTFKDKITDADSDAIKKTIKSQP